MNLQLLNPLRWNKSFLITLLSAFVIIWFSFLDTYSLKTRWDLHSQKEDYKARTEQLRAESEELRKKIDRLEKDPALLEKIAREDYGMKKPGETVYKVRREE